MKDKKAAKKLLRLAKEHPDWYSKKDIFYAKQIRKQLKREKKQHEREISDSNSKGRRDHGLRGKSEQPKESGQPQGSWFVRLLHKARSLVSL
tara:strand:+ start:488 stop:763 length:276 start_codon:yes stop_codon:yes gene_type:complete